MKPLTVAASSALLLTLAAAWPAFGDDSPPQIVVVQPECEQFWSEPDEDTSPAAWNAMLSFAACTQDASVQRVLRVEQLGGVVEQMQEALGPPIRLYFAAVENGPPDIKLRAGYAIAVAQITLMTRARMSLAAPELRDRLEELLEPHARLAYFIFTAIDRIATETPEIAPDAVTRYMVRSSREYADALLHRWAPREQRELREIIASPR